VYICPRVHEARRGVDRIWIPVEAGMTGDRVAAVFLSVAIGCMWFVTRGEAREA